MSERTHKNYLKRFLDERSHDGLQRQQIITYLIATCLVTVGMPLHLLNIIGSEMPVLRWLSVTALVMSLATFGLWFFKKLSLKKAFSMIALVVQVVQTSKIMYISLTMPANKNYLVVVNGFISMMLMVMLAISYLRTATIIIGLANTATLIAATVIVNTEILTQAVIVIILFTVFFIALSDMMYRNVKHLQNENEQYHSEEKTLLATLKLNRNEIRSYIKMCRTENIEDQDTDILFGMLSEKSQRNVINAVERKKALDASRKKDISELLPDLTPMELEVARLILRDMKLSQIAQLTNKSESNISVVRSRIRKKMGLSQGEDLREALLKLTKGD